MSVDALTRAIDKITNDFYTSENKSEVGDKQMNVLAKHAGQEMMESLRPSSYCFSQSLLSKIEQEVDKSAKDKPQV